MPYFSSTKEFAECVIVATEGRYFKRPFAWTFPKHSPYLEIFNFYISEVIENGQWNAIMKQYEPAPQICPDSSGKPMEMSSCISAFLVSLFGIVSSLLLLFLECSIKRFECTLQKILPRSLFNSITNRNTFDSSMLSRQEFMKIVNYQTQIINELDLTLKKEKQKLAFDKAFFN